MPTNALIKTALLEAKRPIFIVGCPRSGTTLLQAMLGTQPGVLTFPESHFFELVNEKNDLISPEVLSRSLPALSKNLDMQWPKPLLEEMESLAGQCALNKKTYFELAVSQAIADSKKSPGRSGSRWIEKTPYHIFHLAEIAALFPDAKFVFTLRDPRPVVYSWKTKLPRGKNVSETVIAKIWEESVKAYENFSRQFSEKIFLVKYEDLIGNQDGIVEKLCGFLDIDFHQDLLHSRTNEQTMALPHEVWKRGVDDKKLVNTNRANLEKMNTLGMLRVQYITADTMRKYGYDLSIRPLQSLYNSWLFIHRNLFPARRHAATQ